MPLKPKFIIWYFVVIWLPLLLWAVIVEVASNAWINSAEESINLKLMMVTFTNWAPVFLVSLGGLGLIIWLHDEVTKPIKYMIEKVSENGISDPKPEEKVTMGGEINLLKLKVDDSMRKLLRLLYRAKYKSNHLKSELEKAMSHEQAILSSIPDGIVVLDDIGNLVSVNESATRLLGLDETQIGKKFEWFEGGSIFEVDAVTPVKDKKAPHEMALDGNPVVNRELYMTNSKMPEGMFIRLTALSIKDNDGKVIGCVLTIDDITQEKEIDRVKTEFVSLASHQLRTPLTVVGWYAEMLLSESDGKLTPQQKEYVEEIFDGNKRMVDLVNALLNVSRIELGTFDVKLEQTDVSAIVESVLKELKLLIWGKSLNVDVSRVKHQVIMTDARLMRIVYQNLLTNAVRYTPNNGNINVIHTLKKKGTEVNGKKLHTDSMVVSISDTGYGIPQEQQSKIFTRLFRADNVKQKDTGGTGLGLYITKSIVEHFGGEVWFKSKMNEGTTFYFRLPLTKSKS